MGTRFSKCQDHESIQISPSRAIAKSPTPLFIKRGELQLAKQIEKRKYNDSTNEAVMWLQLQQY